MNLKVRSMAGLCGVALLVASCGGAQTLPAKLKTQPPSVPSPTKVVAAGGLTFKVPSSWLVGRGECRCGWGRPDSATLENGPQVAPVACSCPEASSDAPSGLHLYEGTGGLVVGGRKVVVDGLVSYVTLDESKGTLVATFPAQDQWITIGPAPAASNPAVVRAQVVREKEILATVGANPAGSGGT